MISVENKYINKKKKTKVVVLNGIQHAGSSKSVGPFLSTKRQWVWALHELHVGQRNYRMLHEMLTASQTFNPASFHDLGVFCPFDQTLSHYFTNCAGELYKFFYSRKEKEILTSESNDFG